MLWQVSYNQCKSGVTWPRNVPREIELSETPTEVERFDDERGLHVTGKGTIEAKSGSPARISSLTIENGAEATVEGILVNRVTVRGNGKLKLTGGSVPFGSSTVEIDAESYGSDHPEIDVSGLNCTEAASWRVNWDYTYLEHEVLSTFEDKLVIGIPSCEVSQSLSLCQSYFDYLDLPRYFSGTCENGDISVRYKPSYEAESEGRDERVDELSLGQEVNTDFALEERGTEMYSRSIAFRGSGTVSRLQQAVSSTWNFSAVTVSGGKVTVSGNLRVEDIVLYSGSTLGTNGNISFSSGEFFWYSLRDHFPSLELGSSSYAHYPPAALYVLRLDTDFGAGYAKETRTLISGKSFTQGNCEVLLEDYLEPDDTMVYPSSLYELACESDSLVVRVKDVRFPET
jgi:hypothetical protein